MTPLRGTLAVGLVSGLLAAAAPLRALPKVDEPIDPTKRAPVSTADAVRPAASGVKGNGVVGGRVIRPAKVTVQRSPVADQRAAIDVKETRSKTNVTQPSAQPIVARTMEVSRAADRPAAIPTIDAERFRRMLRDYEKNRVPAGDLASGDIQVGKKRVSLADINRYVDPRATLEAQGIPVTSAGSGESTESTSAPVPVSNAKNGGG